MSSKKIKIDFFISQYGLEGKERLSAALNSLLGKCPVIPMGDYQYEIRELKKDHAGNFYGVFAKFRIENLPHIGRPGINKEKIIVMEPSERLIEKNFFLYERKYELLTFQSNWHGSNSTKMAEYLSHHFEDTVLFYPILQPEPMKRLLSNQVKTKRLTLSCARPKASWYDVKKTGFSDPILEALARSGGHRIKIEITAGRKSFLIPAAKEWIKGLIGELPEEDISTARMQIDEDGTEYPIDLIEDRLKTYKLVHMDGKYPNARDMMAKLREARTEQQKIIEDLFGN